MVFQNRHKRFVVNIIFSCSATANTKEKKGVKKLTDEEVQEHIKKGLCFKCGEKWGVGHKCTTGQVLLIVGISDKEVERVEESEDEDASLSFHALTGSDAPDTFRLLGWIVDHEIKVFVDTGSSHNFISSTCRVRRLDHCMCRWPMATSSAVRR